MSREQIQAHLDFYAVHWGVAQRALVEVAADAVRNWSSASRETLELAVKTEEAARIAFQAVWQAAGRGFTAPRSLS